jgi:hypothetical protein
MDLTVSFLSMLLLLFGLSMVGLGVFTTYFGAGKSRIIGVLLLLIGITVLAIFYIMATDYTGYDWEMDDVSDSFLGVVGIGLGAGAAFGLVIGLMMVIKEDEPDIPGLDDWEKEMDSQKSEDHPSDAGEGIPSSPEPVPGDAGQKSEEEDEEATGDKPPAPEDIPTPTDEIEHVGSHGDTDEPPAPSDTEADEDMTDFLKDKEEKKIVSEEWEKVNPESDKVDGPMENTPAEEPAKEPPNDPSVETNDPVEDEKNMPDPAGEDEIGKKEVD